MKFFSPFLRYIGCVYICYSVRNQFCFNIYGNVPSSFTGIGVSCFQFVFVIRTKYCYSAFVIAKGGENSRAFPFLFPFIFNFQCAALAVVLRHISLSWNILILLFVFYNPLTFSETPFKFSIWLGILTHLRIRFMFEKVLLIGFEPMTFVLCLFKICVRWWHSILPCYRNLCS